MKKKYGVLSKICNCIGNDPILLEVSKVQKKELQVKDKLYFILDSKNSWINLLKNVSFDTNCKNSLIRFDIRK